MKLVNSNASYAVGGWGLPVIGPKRLVAATSSPSTVLYLGSGAETISHGICWGLINANTHGIHAYATMHEVVALLPELSMGMVFTVTRLWKIVCWVCSTRSQFGIQTQQGWPLGWETCYHEVYRIR